MNLSETDIFQLEALWQNSLDPSEKEALEKRLQEDAEFQKAAENWKLIVTKGFLPPTEEQKELAEIKARMLGYAEVSEASPKPEQEKEQKTERKPIIRRLYIGLAAAAALLLLLWLGPLQGLLLPDSPTDQFFAHLPRDNANLSGDGETGQQAYDRKAYKKAYPALLEEVEAGGDSLSIIYAGVAAIGSGQAEKAIPLLEPLLSSENWRLYEAEISWYLALAYVDQQQWEQANTLLLAIAQTDGPYSAQAKELIQQIQSK